jgi:flagellar protein FliS
MTGNSAYLESRILSADPVELIAILYEHAILSVEEAREHLAKKEIAQRARKISKAIAIVSELDSSLNHSIGGEMSRNLARLYQYMRERLTAANIQQADAPLAEVESLLNTLAQGWEGVKRAVAQTPSVFPAAGSPTTVTSPATSPETIPNHFSTPFFVGTDPYQLANSWTA